jgi:hypothetical protein
MQRRCRWNIRPGHTPVQIWYGKPGRIRTAWLVLLELWLRNVYGWHAAAFHKKCTIWHEKITCKGKRGVTKTEMHIPTVFLSRSAYTIFLKGKAWKQPLIS